MNRLEALIMSIRGAADDAEKFASGEMPEYFFGGEMTEDAIIKSMCDRVRRLVTDSNAAKMTEAEWKTMQENNPA